MGSSSVNSKTVPFKPYLGKSQPIEGVDPKPARRTASQTYSGVSGSITDGLMQSVMHKPYDKSDVASFMTPNPENPSGFQNVNEGALADLYTQPSTTRKVPAASTARKSTLPQ